MEKHSLAQRVTGVSSPARYAGSVILVRIMLGFVFVTEGIQKFLFPLELGAGRFVKIGIPAPEVMGPFVGAVEIIFGILILVGLASRLSALPLLVDMLVAIASTKIPILLQNGFWKMAHEARVDFSMFLGLLFILIVGSGRWSFDSWYAERQNR